MPETMGTYIRDAAEEILIQAAEQPLDADVTQKGIRLFNNVMDSLKSEFRMEYTKVFTTGDLVSIPDECVWFAKLKLAKALAPSFDVQLTPVFMDNYKDAQSQAYAWAAKNINKLERPRLLPTGSGNNYWNGSSGYAYFDREQPQLIVRAGNSAVTTLVADTPTQIIATWGEVKNRKFTQNTNGQWVYTAEDLRNVKLIAEIFVTAASSEPEYNFSFAYRPNGGAFEVLESTKVKQTVSTTTTRVLVECPWTLYKDDALSLYVEAIGHTTSIAMKFGTVEIRG